MDETLNEQTPPINEADETLNEQNPPIDAAPIEKVPLLVRH